MTEISRRIFLMKIKNQQNKQTKKKKWELE
jgi:hypothetical protein